jgi:hypothetical protein
MPPRLIPTARAKLWRIRRAATSRRGGQNRAAFHDEPPLAWAARPNLLIVYRLHSIFT